MNWASLNFRILKGWNIGSDGKLFRIGEKFAKWAKKIQVLRKFFSVLMDQLNHNCFTGSDFGYRKLIDGLSYIWSYIVLVWHHHMIHMKSEKTWFWNENRYGWSNLAIQMYISSQIQSHGERASLMPSLMRVKVKILIGWASHPNRLLPK